MIKSVSRAAFKIVGLPIHSLFGWVPLHSVGRLVGGSLPTMAADTATDSARKGKMSLRSASRYVRFSKITVIVYHESILIHQ